MKSFLALGLAAATGASAQNVISQGTGFGTYYYDIEQRSACGSDFTNIDGGYVRCDNAGLTLNQINSNYVVAMNNTLLGENLAGLCGRRVVVTVNGVQSDMPFFIGDGCQRCATGPADSPTWNPDGAPGLDFSYSALSQLSSQACAAGHIDLSWEIVDETLYHFDTNAPGQPTGPAKREVFQA